MAIIFGILAAIVTAAAIWVGLHNNQASSAQYDLFELESTQNAEKGAKKAQLDGDIKETNESFEKRLKTVVERFDIRDGKETQKKELESKVVTLDEEIVELNTKLDDYKEKLPDADGVDALITELKEVNEEVAKIEVGINEAKAENEKLGLQIASQKSKIEFNSKWIKNQTQFVSQDTFTGKVKAVYSEWGFVVLDSGDIQGVTARSFIEVHRAGELIGLLKVKTLMNNTSTADILFETFVGGKSVRAGDIIKAKPVAQVVVEELAKPEEPVTEEVVEEVEAVEEMPEKPETPAAEFDPFS